MDEKQINELIECPVCLERMDQTCKVLRCQHTFCRRCLDEILVTKNELRCPECRALVTERLDALPTNILVMRILEGLKTKGVKPHSNGGRPSPSPRVASSSSFRRELLPRQGSQPCARALYNYESTVAEDLTFKKGDIINLKRQIDDNWYQGEMSGVVGHFPGNFVQVIVPLVQMPQCKALYDFDLKDEGEKDCLSFKKDETLTVIRRVDENWLEGRKGDKIGIFPIVFVELNDTAKVLISTKTNRSILQQAAHLPSTPSTPSTTPVTITSTSSVAATLTTDLTNSIVMPPQRTISAPGGVEPPPVPELVVSQSGASVDDSLTPQVISQQPSTAATETSPATSLTSSECSAVSSSSSPGDPLAGSHQSQADQAAMSNSAVATASADVAVSEDPSPTEHTSASSAKPDPSAQQNKRHSYTQSSINVPSSFSSSSSSTGAHQNRHSAEITLPSEFGSVQSGPSSISPTPASTNVTEPMTLDTTETHLKAALISPKQRHLASPTSAALSDSNAESSPGLTAPVYTALYCYRPQKDDELELTKGDQYTVTEKCQDGWFKGACLRTGQSGVFPGNYVHLARHTTSAFKPVHPNILNIRAKGPHMTPPALPSHETSASSSVGVGGGDTSQGPPPLLPRVAKLGAQAQRSKSPSIPAPLRSLSHPATSSIVGSGSSSRFHMASPFLPSSSPSSHLAGISLSSKPLVPAPPPSTSSHGHHTLHWSSQQMPGLASIGAQPMPNLASLSSQPMPSLASMCASASITPPPNVVMAPGHHSSAPQEKEKKEKKEKEKKGFGKLFAGKHKKNKHAHTDSTDGSSTMAVLCFDNVGLAHVRSGSYPAENLMSTGDMGSLLGTTHSRKASSFDAVNTAIPPVPAKPRPKPTYRERYCCVVPYPPQTEHELSLELGDIIHVHRKRDDGWYKGTQERTGRTGLFPASFVEKL